MKRISIVDEVENYLFNKYLSMYYTGAVLSTNRQMVSKTFFSSRPNKRHENKYKYAV